MSLSTELAKAFPRIPHPLMPRKKCALEVQADNILMTFGGVGNETKPNRDALAFVEQELIRDEHNLERFTLRDFKAVPYVIWGLDARWRLNSAFISRFLSIAETKWSSGLRRLWRHYVMNFERDSPGTALLATWIDKRKTRLPEPLIALSRKFELFEVETAPSAVACALIAGQNPMVDFEAVGLPAAMLKGTPFMVEILVVVGRLLSAGSDAPRIPAALSALIADDVKDALAGASCSRELRDRALRSVVDGLVAWQLRMTEHDIEPEPTVNFLLALNGDPRFARERWNGRVNDGSIEAMHRWLSRKTIEAFFRVIDALQTDRPDMWRERKKFWLSYLPYVSGAWLVVGPRGVALAEREKMRFARFASGGGTQNDHCGLMLQIRNACVLEMNKNGSAIFWQGGLPSMPQLYEDSYDRNRIRFRGDGKEVFVEGHQGDWQTKFRLLLMRMTGLNVRG